MTVSLPSTTLPPSGTEGPSPEPLKHEIVEFVSVGLGSASGAGFGGAHDHPAPDARLSGLQSVPGGKQVGATGVNSA